MSITWTYKITQLTTVKHAEISNVISHVHWQLTGTDEAGFIASSSCTTPFQLDRYVATDSVLKKEQFVTEAEFNTANYTPYDQLTEETIIGWVQNHASSVVIDQMKAALTLRLEKMHVPQAQNLPWVADVDPESIP
jgi:hypothetical protein